MHASYKELLQYQRAHKYDTYGQPFFGHMSTLCGKH